MDVTKQCPWCSRWFLKDNNCAYIFACGLDYTGKFHLGAGCGKSWCWTCGKKFCGQYIDQHTGIKTKDAKDFHDKDCCKNEKKFLIEDFCEGGHSSHCSKRW